MRLDSNISNYVLSTSNTLVDAIKNNKSSQWTTSNNMIYYNTSNIGIGTHNPISKLHIYNNITDTTKLTIQNELPPTSVSSLPPATTTATTGIYSYMVFTYTTETAGTGSGQSLYTFNISSGSIACDILIIAGGGGGGKTDAGGGGAGGLIYVQNTTLTGNYTINVGKGGIAGVGSYGSGVVGGKGTNTSFTGTNANYVAYGGGGGGYGSPTDVEPANLGPYGSSGGLGTGDITRETFNVNTEGQGFLGGLSRGEGLEGAGGGGGSGGVGATTGAGGVGTQIDITGVNLYYAGGGAGGHNTGGASGGLGGGGGAVKVGAGSDATFYGSGGGGGGGGYSDGGSGFAGVVIIRYLQSLPSSSSSSIELVRGNTTDDVVDYSVGNFDSSFIIKSVNTGTPTNRFTINSAGNTTFSGSINATSYLLNGSDLLGTKQDTLTSLNTIGVFNTSHFTNNTGTNKIDITSSSLSKWTNNSVDATKIYYNGGNVGIGTTNPTTAKLEVWGNLLMSSTNWVAGANVRILGLNTDKMIEFSFDNGTTIYDNNAIRFRTNGSERMLIATNGNVGIGTTAPQSSYKLQVQGSTWCENQLVFNNLYRGSGADFACNKIALYAGANTPTTTANNGFGIATAGVEYFSGLNHMFYTETTGGTGYGTERMRIASNGNIGIGTTDPLTYKLNVNGTINSSNYTLNGVPLNIGALSQGMTVQTKHLTYTQMDVKNNTGWDAINDDLVNGFVIAITPASASSKILVNMIVHIGIDYPTSDSRWWGIKLYRKIGSGGAWTEITGANGTETGAAIATAGTPVWISHNMGMEGTVASFITNVVGTYLDAPNTTSIVYYTAYWNHRVGDNPSPSGFIYLNRAFNHNDAWRPAPSSSWTATEIWDLGTPYVPPSGDTTITIASSSVGVGTTPTVNHKLIVNQGLTGTTGVTCIPLRISSGAYNDLGNGTATLIGLSTEPSGWTKCAIGHCRTGGWDTGAIVFICNSAANTTSLTMADERMRITSTGNVGIGTNNPLNILQVGAGQRLKIANSSTDVTMIGTDETEGTNTRINIFGATHASAPGQISYVAKSTGNHIFFTTNSDTERMRIASNGNVGIGTNNPTSGALTIYGTTLNRANSLYIQSPQSGIMLDSTLNGVVGTKKYNIWSTTTADSAGAGAFAIFDETGSAYRMVIGSSGNVSIGATDTATYKLNVNGSLNATSLFVGGTAFTGSSQWVGTTDIYNITGNVGIGTSTVNERLTIRGTIGRQMMLTCTTASTSSYMGFSNSAGDGLAYIGLDGLGLTGFVYGALTLGTWKDTPILFTTGATNTEKMRIGSNGNVSIGSTDTATYRLRVEGTSFLNGQIYVGAETGSSTIFLGGGASGDGTYSQSVIETRLYSGTENTELVIFKGNDIGTPVAADRIRLRAGAIVFDTFPAASTDRIAENIRMVIDGSGNVGIGTSDTPTALLDLVKPTAAGVATDIINMRLNADWGLKLQQNYTGAGNIQYDFIHRYSSVNYNALTFKGAFLGIGTTSPTNKLHIVHSSTAANADTAGGIGLYVYNPTNTAGNNSVIINRIAGSAAGKVLYGFDVNAAYGYSIYMLGSSSSLRFNNNWDGGGTDVMVLGNNGNVGIGNTAPLGPLHIANGALANNDGFLILAKCTTVGTTRMFRIGLDAGFNIVIGDYGGGNTAGTWLSSFVMNYQAPANSLAIASNGYVGLGVAPSYKCHIKTSYDTVATGLHLDASDTSDANKYAMTIWSYVVGSGQVGWRFRTQSSTGGVCTPLTFNHAGFVGINGVTPTSALHVNGNAYVTGELRVDGGKFVINGIQPTIYFRDSNQRQGMIHVNGNLMYFLSGPTTGTTDGTDNWEQNNGQWPLYLNLTNNLANFGGSIEAVGNVSAYVSDMRLKTKTANIKEPLEIINKLTGFYYTLNDVAKSYGFKNNKQEIGLSAQDVESVLPELVSIAPFDRKTDDDENVSSKSGENYLTVSYERLTPVLVEAIKELNQKNIALTKENDELKDKYNKLLEDITLIKQTLNLI